MSILNADARHIPLADETVQTVVTSPPYWGLRDYGIEDGIGLEDSPDAWAEQMVEVFREVRRVLRPDGTVWLNVGDTYSQGSHPGYQGSTSTTGRNVGQAEGTTLVRRADGLAPKQLVGLPWRLAFALQADGWWLRSDIVWSKPNPMPESVTDRPTKAHEYVFLLTKGPRYFYDADAVREAASPNTQSRGTKWLSGDMGKVAEPGSGVRSNSDFHRYMADLPASAGRNLRTVWTVPTQPFPEAHFATFPEALVLPCIRAGTSEKGACGECGAPWERVTEVERGNSVAGPKSQAKRDQGLVTAFSGYDDGSVAPRITTVGWQPTCDCPPHCPKEYTAEECPPWEECRHGVDYTPVPCLVLDPFCGSGTTGVVARKLGRRFVGLDLSEDYCRMARRRIRSEGRVQTKGSMKKLDPDRFEEVGLL